MTSQILAIFYLNDIDHMIKEKLKMIFMEIKEKIKKL